MKINFFLRRISNDTNETNRQEVQNKNSNISTELWNCYPQGATEIRRFYLSHKLEVFICLDKFVQNIPFEIKEKDISGEVLIYASSISMFFIAVQQILG